MSDPSIKIALASMPSTSESASPHQYFAFVGSEAPKVAVRDVARQLANFYFKCDLSRNQWSKAPPAICRWEAPEKHSDGTVTMRNMSSAPLHLRNIERALAAGTFDFDGLGLPDPMSHWLDSSVQFAPYSHIAATDGSHELAFCAQGNLGPQFPIVAAIDREGVVLTSFQTILLRRIGESRRKLVEDSTDPASDDWFQTLRTLVSECVSLIDNTLHQLYFKAQYDPLPGWLFDPAILGERHGRRLMDKVGWVFQITQKPLHARDEIASLGIIKTLRNHLQHFDPPAFACTWEEAAEWLNHALSVVRLAWKIRTCASALPSTSMIEVLLQRAAVFRPQNLRPVRTKQRKDVGYASTSEDALRSPRPNRPHAVTITALPPPRLL